MPAISPGRTRRVFWLGLIVSVLLHLSLLIPEGIHPPVWKQADESAPIEARLGLSPPPLKPVVNPAPPPKPVKRSAREPTPPLAALPLPESEALPDPADPILPPTDEATEVIPIVAPEPQPLPATLPVEALPPLNRLPRRITLDYRLSAGLASGQLTLLWVNEGELYTITSVVSARGLASLAFSGQLVQTSRGRMTATGLRPEEFWDQRANKRNQSRFDYAAHLILTDGSKGPRTSLLPAGTQDTQSLLFQIVLTAPPAADSEHALFNGKEVRSYRYRVTGEETLDTPLGPLRTLRIIRLADTDAKRFEIWLAVDHHYLPVKLATEISGYDAELMLQSIASE